MSKEMITALEAVRQIDPASLSYEEWLQVGMALKSAGCSVSDWDEWSSKDKRHKNGECARKWAGFNGSGITNGTLVKLCRERGGKVETSPRDEGHELEWDAVIGGGKEDAAPIRPEWVERKDMPQEPEKWSGVEDLRRYLTVLFDKDEYVGYVNESYKSEDGKWLPKKGFWGRTAGQLLAALDDANGDLTNVVGDWEPECGAWIRFNPFDGSDIKDANVTSFRFSLVESDSLTIERQYDLYTELELPIAAMVHSGGKSLHAIVRIDAKDMAEYKERVDYLYSICRKSGIEIDKQNRNPSRLSRMPGATRCGKRQWLVATNVGKESFQEWKEWVEAANDNLPDVECLADLIDTPPPMANAIIEGILREGHKMLMTGPSKAGKSFLLLQLAIAIAEGGKWIGWQCRQGRVLYVNLELDRASCINRLADVYKALGRTSENTVNIDMWHLRGKAMPMTELAPRLIRRAIKRRYSAIIIDPIYKVITGDENAADQMAKFCNQFDRVCFELGCAVIYCHHHSKGDQGQKRAHDRASGSGVFARDPDALIDLIELEIDDKRRKQISNCWECDAMTNVLDDHDPACGTWREECPPDDVLHADKLAKWMDMNGHGDLMRAVRPDAIIKAANASGWRVEGILREFAPFEPRRMFFNFPIHTMDVNGLLIDTMAEGEHKVKTKDEAIEDKKQITIDQTLNAVSACMENGRASLKSIIEYLSTGKKLMMSDEAVRKRLKNAGVKVEKGFVFEVKEGE